MSQLLSQFINENDIGIGGYVSVTAVTGSELDLSNGSRFFTKTVTGPLAWIFTNVPATGATVVVLELTNGGLGAQVWPRSVSWPGGSAPTLTASGVDVLAFLTDDGGITWRGVVLMLDSKRSTGNILYLAVAYLTSPYITVYPWSTSGFGTKYSNTAYRF